MYEIKDQNKDVFIQNEHLIETSYSSVINEYSEKWFNECILNAYENLSKPEGIMKPHAITLGMFGGKVSEIDLFKLDKRSNWKVRCFIFSTNEKMKEWISNVGEQNVIHEVYV